MQDRPSQFFRISIIGEKFGEIFRLGDLFRFIGSLILQSFGNFAYRLRVFDGFVGTLWLF